MRHTYTLAQALAAIRAAEEPSNGGKRRGATAAARLLGIEHRILEGWLRRRDEILEQASGLTPEQMNQPLRNPVRRGRMKLTVAEETHAAGIMKERLAGGNTVDAHKAYRIAADLHPGFLGEEPNANTTTNDRREFTSRVRSWFIRFRKRHGIPAPDSANPAEQIAAAAAAAAAASASNNAAPAPHVTPALAAAAADAAVAVFNRRRARAVAPAVATNVPLPNVLAGLPPPSAIAGMPADSEYPGGSLVNPASGAAASASSGAL